MSNRSSFDPLLLLATEEGDHALSRFAMGAAEQEPCNDGKKEENDSNLEVVSKR
jgi:hypothetical protein